MIFKDTQINPYDIKLLRQSNNLVSVETLNADRIRTEALVEKYTTTDEAAARLTAIVAALTQFGLVKLSMGYYIGSRAVTRVEYAENKLTILFSDGMQYTFGGTQLDVAAIEAAQKINGGGGGGVEEAPIDNKSYVRKNATWVEESAGTTSYDDLTNKPAIDGKELTSSTTASDLGLATTSDLDDKQDTLTAGDNITIVNNVISATGGGGGDVTYSNPGVKNTLGGVMENTVYDAVTIQRVLDDLFDDPEQVPSLTAPSSAFTVTPSTGLREVGERVNLSFQSIFNRGSINPAYGTSGHRAGLPNMYTYTGTGLTSTASTAMSNIQAVNNYVVAQGNNIWTTSISYDAGEQPKTSRGNNYSTPLPAGTTAARSINISGVYPTFATTADINTLTKQTLALPSAAYVETSMVAEVDTSKQMFDVHTNQTVTGVQFFNTISAAWEWLGGSKASSITQWVQTSTTHDVQGTTYQYKRYTNSTATVGARRLRFYFN